MNNVLMLDFLLVVIKVRLDTARVQINPLEGISNTCR
jgi:hypothetical protein